MLVTPEVIQSRNIGLGDDVFLTGLFVHHAQTHRNIPIVRVGNISCMLEESVQTADGLFDAYLVEARSIGGLSGSPVFVVTGGSVRQVGNSSQIGTGFECFLLGLMHGHWVIPYTVGRAVQNELVSMGIAVVIPSERILEALNLPELLNLRQKSKEKYIADNSLMPDAEPPTA